MKRYVKQTHNKELRIGLVLYGGVSLAIYIYGVTYEFLRLARGEGPYGKLLKVTKVKPVIDVISGSSAGGINGLALAKALTTGADFAVLRDLWIRKADFFELINHGSQPKSLFNSDYYIKTLEDALNLMNYTQNEDNIQDGPLDLFITATNLDGEVLEHTDPFLSQILQTRRYTSVFHLKTRPGSYNPFDEQMAQQTTTSLEPEDDELEIPLYQQRRVRNDFFTELPPETDQEKGNPTVRTKDYFLARIAAATSAFPIAFTPVRFEPQDRDMVQKLFEANLITGQKDKPILFGDGGMLDNKPFSYTIQTIFNRHADRPVDRKLFFIEPHPASHEPTHQGLAQRSAPDGVDALIGWLNAKMDESIASDLQTVLERNKQIAEVQTMLHWFEQKMSAYLQNNLLADKIIARETYNQQINFRVYIQLKVDRLRERILDNLVNLEVATDSPSASKWPKNWLKKNSLAILDKETADQNDQINFLQRFDYLFRIRQVRYFITKINHWLELIAPLPDDHEEVERLQGQLCALKGRLYTRIELYTHASWVIWQDIEPVRPDTLYATYVNIRARYDELMEKGYKQNTHRLLTRSFGTIAGTVQRLQYEFNDTNEKRFFSELDYFANHISQIFNAYEFIDMHLYPLVIMADIGETDPIELVRVSPQDATRYGRTVTEKLAGEQIHHFSGFLNESWRRNDIVWGRLDAAEIIVKTLLPPQDDEHEPEREKFRQQLLAELCPTIIKEELNMTEHAFRRHYRVGDEGVSNLSGRQQFQGIQYMVRTGLRLWFNRFEDNPCLKWLGPLLGGLVTGSFVACYTVSTGLRRLFGRKG